ncbi:MAG: gamma-glutamyltransferase [candidate division NC10 bacterium]|nr:gamma-glutamyltransferase [candidate division NC10 bacterium]
MTPTAHRPTVLGTRGMVATPHYLASAAGLRVLQAGGNAVDAVIAAAAVCSVVYPHMCSIGGDNFWLIYDAKGRTVRALNGSGRSGERCTIDLYTRMGSANAIPSRGFLAANTVPGAVDGWATAHEYGRWSLGTKVLWSSIFEEAIEYAEAGYPVTPSQAVWTARNIADESDPQRGLQRWEGFRRTYLKPDGRPYPPGEVMKQPDLARTLKSIAFGGGRFFYEGDITRRIVRYLDRHGGVLTERDFYEHHADWVDPIRVDYRGYTVHGFPPNTQGMAALLILSILSHFDLKKVGEGTTDYYHLQVEATKLAFADRDRWVTDPTCIQAPLDRLLSRRYTEDRARMINMTRSVARYEPGLMKGDTVYIGAVDAAGNGVSMLQSIYFDFGSGIVAGDTGVLLQNRGSFFSLDPTHVNHLAPRKRTFHTLIPAMLLKDDRLFLVYGAMGGEGQPQTQSALVSRIVDFGFGLQESIEAPRWLYGRTWGMTTTDLCLEARVPEPVVEGLRHRGHPVRVVGAWDDVMGHAQAILIHPETGVRHGGADPRGDGQALGY